MSDKIYNVNLDYHMIEKIALRLVAYGLAFSCGTNML
jgi:predicted transcriptional regulator